LKRDNKILSVIVIIGIIIVAGFYIYLMYDRGYLGAEDEQDEIIETSYIFKYYLVPKTIRTFIGIISFIEIDSITQIETYCKCDELVIGQVPPELETECIKAVFLNKIGVEESDYKIDLCRLCDACKDIESVPVFISDDTYTLEKINEIIEEVIEK